MLVERGACSPEVIDRAERAAKAAGTRLCSQLLAMKVCDERILVSVLADKLGVPGVDLSRTVVPLEVLSHVPRPVAEADLILPLSKEGGRIHLAIATIEMRVIDEVRFVSQLEVSTYVALHSPLQRAIGEAYDAEALGEATWRGADAPAARAHVAMVLPKDAGGGESTGPADLPYLVPDDVVEIALDGGGGEVVAEIRAHSGAKRILVVDDEPEIRKLVERTLASKGYAVDVAADGEEALASVLTAPPDLVMLDAMLPRLHGFEVCLRMRSDPRTRHVPVIIMTAVYRGWRFAQDARENYGAEDYIEKPFHIDDLLRRVDTVLEATASRSLPTRAVDSQLRRGKELMTSGRLPDAVVAFEEAVRSDRFFADGHYHLARALRALGEHFRAMTEFELAVEMRPGFFVALRSLAALYMEKGFRRKAVETLERAMAAAPDEATRQGIKDDLVNLL